MTESLSIVVKRVSKQVTVNQAPLTILNSISFSVKSGATVSIMGASGSGKSTLLSLLAGLDRPSTGEIWIQQQGLHDMTEEARARLRLATIGFVFQSFFLLPSLTACENVMLPLELQGKKGARSHAEQLLAQVGLADRLHSKPGQLSGGEQQRVALARAFITRPAVLLADEPTGNLDYATGQHVADQLFELNRQFGTTLVVVTHDPALAARCQVQWRMQNGSLVTAAEHQPVGA
jgi:putative ABC transport system ATP-binding protein